MKPVVFSDHPDHGWKWTDLELRWIAERDEQWKERIAQLERELAECKAALAIERECPPEMKDYALTYRDMELERDALAAQVVQMRDALEATATYSHKPDDVKRWADEALAPSTLPPIP